MGWGKNNFEQIENRTIKSKASKKESKRERQGRMNRWPEDLKIQQREWTKKKNNDDKKYIAKKQGYCYNFRVSARGVSNK